MPVVGWICPNTRKKEPFGHFDTCRDGIAGRPAYSPFFAAVEEAKIAEDIRHSTLDMTITQTMDCPRAIYLERTTKYYIDPTKRAAMTRGTALHSVMAKTLDPKKYITEGNDTVRMDVRGVLFGQPMSALLDILRADYSEIIDGKFPKDWSVRYRDKAGRVKPEYAVQLNGQRLLLAQQDWAIKAGFDPDKVLLTNWDHALGDVEGPAAMHAQIMDETQMAAIRPWGSAFTIQEHVDTLAEVKAAHEALTPGDAEGQERLAASIPLVGEAMLGKKKCNGCAVKQQCDALVSKYGRPMV